MTPPRSPRQPDLKFALLHEEEDVDDLSSNNTCPYYQEDESGNDSILGIMPTSWEPEISDSLYESTTKNNNTKRRERHNKDHTRIINHHKELVYKNNHSPTNTTITKLLDEEDYHNDDDDMTRSTVCSSSIDTFISRSVTSDETTAARRHSLSTKRTNRLVIKGSSAPQKKKIIQRTTRPTYPMLDPLPTTTNNRTDTTNHDYDNNAMMISSTTTPINYPLQIEMAKSAFLKNPCKELWYELVHSFRMLSSDEKKEVDTTCREETTDWAKFEEEHFEQVSSDDQQHALNDTSSFLDTFIGNVEVSLLDDWSEERDVSITPSCEDSSICSEYNPDLIFMSVRQSLNEGKEVNDDSCPFMMNEVVKNSADSIFARLEEAQSATSHVRNEVQHWEECIGKSPQKYVSVVAAALEEDIQTNNAGIMAGTASWKVGKIVEVGKEYGLDEEDVLFVV